MNTDDDIGHVIEMTGMIVTKMTDVMVTEITDVIVIMSTTASTLRNQEIWIGLPVVISLPQLRRLTS
jgi:hypothetical protein